MTLHAQEGVDRELAEHLPDLISALDAAGVAILGNDLGGRFLAWNDGAERLFGRSAGEVLGRPAARITNWGISRSEGAAVARATAEAPWVSERTVVTAAGLQRLRIVAFRLAPDSRHIVSIVMPNGRPAADSTPDRLFRALVERATDLPLICDENLVIRYAGPSLPALFGYRGDEVIGAPGWAFVHHQDEARVHKHWEKALRTPGAMPPIALRVRHRDGSWRTAEISVTNLLAEPDVAGMVVNVRDISDRQSALEQLAERQRFFRSLLDAAQEGVWAIDVEGRTLFANATMAEFLGVTHEQISTGSIWDFYDPEAQQIIRNQMARRRVGETDHYELPFQRHGERRWLLISAAPLTDENGHQIGSVGMSVDITDRKRAEEQLQRLALHDTLTGLPNRALLQDRFDQLADHHERSGAGLAVLFCDLDRFKLVNDNSGHEVGDQVLIRAAARLREVARDEDTVARFGGDQFVILCPDTDAQIMRRLAEDITQAFTEPLDLPDRPLVVGMSVGGACTDDVPVEALFRAADRAVARAKAHGRGRYELHDRAIEAATEGHLELLEDLRQALLSNTLQMHYQPIVRANGDIVGVEALLRWTHPTHGPVSPAVVVELAEAHGLIHQLGTWTLRRACDDIAALSEAADLGVGVAVNVSTVQLQQPHFVTTVRQALVASGLPAERLTLEVTETALVRNTKMAIPCLRALRELGVRLSLDDFGTGYSSLSYLREFPVHAIKIDRSFVAGIEANRDDLAIVASLIDLAATVGLDLVAEGVETPHQAQILRRLGCTAMQGFLWSPALPPTDLATLLRRGPVAPQTPVESLQSLPHVGGSQVTDATRRRILALHRSGASPTTIAAALNAEGHKTPHGARWHRNSVANVIAEQTYPELRRRGRQQQRGTPSASTR